MKLRSIVSVIAAGFLLLVIGCAGSADLSRCSTPNPEVVQLLASGLTVDGKGGLRAAQAVKSKDIAEQWFLAADIQGPGLDGTGEIAVWGLRNVTDLAKMSPTVWANYTAKEFSEFGVARQDRWFNPNTDGLKEAEDCVKHILK
jgi:hypothetical protein